jgi:trimethylamine:corrinoid methyltransferase-like protein
MAIGLPSVMDLQTARQHTDHRVGLPAAAAALAPILKLPFMGTAASDIKAIDAQAGMEAAMQIILSA